MSTPFVHLRLHTDYSLVDGVVQIKPLIKRLTELQMPACGISDECNFYGLIKFYKAAQAAGIKPICGSDFVLAGDGLDGATTRFSLFAMNDTGYRNITRLISRAYQ